VRQVRKQLVIGGLVALAACAGACTKVRQAVDPLPPTALPRIALHEEPTRRPWPVATRPTSSPPDAGPPAIIDTLNGDPKGLKREEINSALQEALPALAGCMPASGPPSFGLSFDAEPDGHATNIQVNGASGEAATCVSATLARLKLPVFEGKAVPVQFPISVYRPLAPPTPAAAVETAPPPATVVGATVPAAPPPGTSTAPYVPPSMPATSGSTPAPDQIHTFIQP
jgi:hypothetical protein